MNEGGAETGSQPQSKLVLERTYSAGVDELWALWTTKSGFESWWGPKGFRVEVHALDARVGGRLQYDMIANSPQAIDAMNRMGQPLSHMTNGHFGEFRPGVRLTLIHLIDFIPDSEPYESLTEVDFEALGDRARMVITVHPHRDPHWTRMASEGFRSQLSKLDERYGIAKP